MVFDWQAVAADQLRCPREVQFVVPVRVNFGDCVKVVGNESALGCWDSNRAVPLKWNEGNIWTNKVDLSPGPYEFKVGTHLALFDDHLMH